jgi:hypothetical protein
MLKQLFKKARARLHSHNNDKRLNIQHESEDISIKHPAEYERDVIQRF